jgi:hypothetical protein
VGLDASLAGEIDAALAPPSTCESGPSPPPPTVNSSALKVWANEGEDKVTRDELRLSNGKDVTSRAWDGSKITLFGARNETVSFNLVLEAASAAASGISVAFDTLDTGCGSTIVGKTATGDGVYDYTTRDIELFYVRYLQIKGLSQFGYETYDELAVPKRLRRPYTVNKNGRGIATGGWTDRPDHDKFYPDIAVPLDLVPTFSIAAGQSQSIWGDIYIPSDVAPGTYYGYVKVSEAGSLTHAVPIEGCGDSSHRQQDGSQGPLGGWRLRSDGSDLSIRGRELVDEPRRLGGCACGVGRHHRAVAQPLGSRAQHRSADKLSILLTNLPAQGQLWNDCGC